MSKPQGGGVAGDEVELIVTGEDGKVKKVVSTARLKDFESAAKNMHFCPDCGERLTEIPLYMCEICGQRYVARIEPTTGKTIIFAIGKETKVNVAQKTPFVE